MQLVVFTIDKRKFCLPLANVKRVIRAVAVTELPRAPQHQRGIINLEGQAIAVLDLRACLGFPSHPIRLSDQFIILNTDIGVAAIIVTSVDGVITVTPEQVTYPSTQSTGEQIVTCLVHLGQEMLILLNPNNLLHQQEQVDMEQFLSQTLTDAEMDNSITEVSSQA